MRVLITSWAWASHLYPMVPTASALRTAGHEVLIGCPPALVRTALRTGLPVVPLGTDVDLAPVMDRLARRTGRPRDSSGRPEHTQEHGNGPGSGRVRTPLTMFAVRAEAMADDLLDLCRRWRPDVIVHDPSTYAAPAVGLKLGIPAVRHLWGLDFCYPLRDFEPAALAPLHRQLGLSGVPVSGAEAATIDPCPPELQLPVDYTPLRVRHIPFNGTGTLDHSLLHRSSRPRICVTWGTTSARFGWTDPALTDVFTACAQLDVDLVFAASGEEQVAFADRPGWRTAVMQPLNHLLSACDLVVGQGGSGTVMTALAAGLPQVCLPCLPDQTATAQRLAATDAGVVVDPAAITPSLLRDALLAALQDPRHAAAARRMREQIQAQPTPDAITGALEDLVRRAAANGPRPVTGI